MFCQKVLLLAVADAMFAGAGAAHRVSTLHQAMCKRIGFLGLPVRKRTKHMKIAISYVAHNRARKT